MHLSRFHLFLALVALVLLRVTVGYHFFKEGTNKLRDGNFDAYGFLSSAKGPLAPQFKSMLDDPEGHIQFGVVVNDSSEGKPEIAFDPSETFDAWESFIDKANAVYRFGDESIVEDLKRQRETLAKSIKTAQQEGKPFENMEKLRNNLEQQILKIRDQPKQSAAIFEDYKSSMEAWLAGNKAELTAHYGSTDREQGFARDGSNSAEAALYVDSLRGQVDSIKSDRSKKLRDWQTEVGELWDALEGQVNSLAVEEQVRRAGSAAPVALERPFAPSNSPLTWINRIIPWFDTIVGVLLIVGLFTRLASGAAAAFLVSVILTQPPWIPGTQPTYFYCIELAALLVLFATCAGRIAGLDFFLFASSKSAKKPATA